MMMMTKRTQMPSPKRYDTTINCTEPDGDNPLTVINRGPVRVAVRYLEPFTPDSEFFLEIKIGKRRVRTAFTKHFEHQMAIQELLEHLGFEATVISTTVDMDEEYD
jgi:hypothetical protein